MGNVYFDKHLFRSLIYIGLFDAKFCCLTGFKFAIFLFQPDDDAGNRNLCHYAKALWLCINPAICFLAVELLLVYIFRILTYNQMHGLQIFSITTQALYLFCTLFSLLKIFSLL